MNGIQWSYYNGNYSFDEDSATGNSVFGGGLGKIANSCENQNGVYRGSQSPSDLNSVESVQERARKRALKKLVSQMEQDLETDDALKECETRKQEASDDIKVRQQQIKELDKAKEQVLEVNGMTDEDVDWNKLHLVETSITHPENLTTEDKNTLAQIPDTQKTILLCEAMKNIHGKEISNDNMRKEALGRAEAEMEIEQLKVHPMVDAKKEADAIMEEARKTVLDKLTEEGIDRIDEEREEAEEIQEKKEEEQQQVKERAEDGELQPEQTEWMDSVREMQNVSQKQEKIQRAVKELLAKELLLDDDLLGINVDETR